MAGLSRAKKRNAALFDTRNQRSESVKLTYLLRFLFVSFLLVLLAVLEGCKIVNGATRNPVKEKERQTEKKRTQNLIISLPFFFLCVCVEGYEKKREEHQHQRR